MKREDLEVLFKSAIANLKNNISKVNDLNVFPIPDGDTGINMLSTLLGGLNAISKNSLEFKKIFSEYSKGSLFGARGNSGVILSQIINGLNEGLTKYDFDFEKIINNLKDFFSIIEKIAYSSVANPVEGTILSVVKAWTKNSNEISKSNSPVEFVEKILEVSKIATKKTKEQLDVLKKADVIDSGAFGLTLIIEGALNSMKGHPVVSKEKEEFKNEQEENVEKDLNSFNPNENIGYCTEFILGLKDPKNFNDKEFKNHLNKLGDSIIFIRDENIVKIHIHLENPGKVFNFAQKYGEFIKLKSENMALQVEENESFVLKNTDELGIVVVSNGEGLNKEFKKLGADVIIDGGQSSNPSINEIITSIEKLKNKNILILPNNSNIVFSVNQVLKQMDKLSKNLFTIPTKSLIEGLLVVENVSKKDMTEFKEFEEDFKILVDEVKQAKISKSIKNTSMNNLEIKKEDYISIKNGEIVSSSKNFENEVINLISNFVKEDPGIANINFYYNDEIVKRVEELKKLLGKKFVGIDFNFVYGGQEIYLALIAFE